MIKRYGRIVCCVLTCTMVACALGLALQRPPRHSYADFTAELAAGQVRTVNTQRTDQLQYVLQDGTVYRTDHPQRPNFKEELLLAGVEVQSGGVEPVTAILIAIGAACLLAFFLRKRDKATAGPRGHGTMEVGEQIPTLHFSDVAAQEEAVDSLRGLVDFIRFPEKYARYGARIPRGVLLYGPPGTGKTLLARALAGEAGVPFFNVCGSDFVQMYVGVGAGRVRDLFRKARKAGKAVLFIDEIDALGKRRDNGNEEREQTLNALLTEMSGFRGDQGIVVIAATNRIDTLDEALLRPGRFDRQIEVGLPGCMQRLRILQVHARNKPMAPDVDLQKLAMDAVFFSGAKLESMLNEAAILAARREAEMIGQTDIAHAFQTVMVGDEKQDRSDIGQREREITAYHEAGHALATLHLMPESRLTRVSIIPSTRGAAGYSMAVMPDRQFFTRAELEAHIGIALAGRVAEELVFGADQMTTGAGNDLSKATELCVRMCMEWGMDAQLGLPTQRVLTSYGLSGGQDVSDAIRTRLAAHYARVLALLTAHRDTLERIAQALLVQESLTGEALAALLAS
ncbi:MAG: AAA family ATPase [Clostridia bacterium]